MWAGGLVISRARPREARCAYRRGSLITPVKHCPHGQPYCCKTHIFTIFNCNYQAIETSDINHIWAQEKEQEKIFIDDMILISNSSVVRHDSRLDLVQW